ncbi:MFS transporter [Sphingomonas profundi]|uniref:MFS transporter n=1 Tax=Alterirhizorhabdus profundi TaxID=2681549 RepID=UPI0012E6F8C7|nr:MFS transporter [Sphingomonas profundi]
MATIDLKGTVATPRTTAWTMVALLFGAQTLNYFDKTVLGIAAPAIMAELGLDARQYGLVASSFFSLYAVTGLAVAFLAAPRVRPRFIMAALLLVWAVSQFPIVFAASFGTLVLCRVVLGMGEGAGVPTAINACHEWFALEERATPTAWVLFGSQAGSLLAAPSLSYLVASFGWRSAFLACGLMGVALLALWTSLSRDGPYSALAAVHRAPAAPSGITQRDIWTDRSVIGCAIVGFGSYWVVGFAIAWLPLFAREKLALGTVGTGWALAAAYVAQAIIQLSISFLAQRNLRRGVPARKALGWAMAACMIGGAGAFVAGALVHEPVLAYALVVVGSALPLAIFTIGATMLGGISPDDHRNRLITIIFSVVTLAAIPSPMITGFLVSSDPVNGWSHALIAVAAIAGAAGVVALLSIHPERSVARFARLAR